MAATWQIVFGSVLLAGFAAAQEPAMGPTIEGVVHWPAAKIKAYPAGLKAKEPTVRGDRKSMMALERIGNRNGYSFTEERRDESGVPEMHTGLEDILIIHDGEVTMVYGGKMEDRQEPRPGEFRGSKITGGTAVKLAAGDMLLVPERVPHHMIVEKGKSVTFMAIKVQIQK
jgi:mannose-6-phosphate isomerase-like protein (cupin superfamily)